MPVDYLQVNPHIVRITLNRPQVMNALDLSAIQAFASAVARAHADPGLRVLILTGAGERAFCSGGDLVELADLPTEMDGRRVSAGMTAALAQLETLPVPTIAAINGLCRGGGSEIALACDLRLLADSATIGFTQISLGLTPGWGGGQRLLQLVGYTRAMEILLDGRILDSGEALALGLVNRILPQERLHAEVTSWAHQIAARPPKTVRAIKQILTAGSRFPVEHASAIEADAFPPLWADDEHHRLVETFLNRSRH